ncbi:MAG TPA: substrate-binding domain-containing protein [Gemmatimonadaceae bacterium]|nr:substrate-binding domain-containing protein [Gemmatimonadaceae bacterium]
MRVLRIVVALLALAGARAAHAQAGYRVIVNAANPAESISRTELSRLFLKKVTTWKTGRPVVVVDQVENASARAQFTREVHEREITSVKSYWQQMVFAGRAVPPTEKPSDADVLAFVRANPNAVGYVSANATLADGVKVLAVNR